jgi:hypothetical protein
MPCLGQCLNLGTARKTHVARILAPHQDAVTAVGRVNASYRKFMCARKASEPNHVIGAESRKQRSAALDPQRSQAVTDRVTRISSDGLLEGS